MDFVVVVRWCKKICNGMDALGGYNQFLLLQLLYFVILSACSLFPNKM